MYKKKVSTLIIQSIAALSRLRSCPPPPSSLFICSPLRTLCPLHQSPKAPPLIQQWRWLSIAAQRNDYCPDSFVGRELTNEPYFEPHCSSPPGTYQDSNGYHREAGGVHEENSDGLYPHGRNGVPSESNQILRPGEHQWSNVGANHGGFPNGTYGRTQMNGSGIGNEVTGNFYQGGVPNGTYGYTQMNGSGIGSEVTGNFYQGGVPNGTYGYTQMNGGGIGNEVTGNFYRGPSEHYSGNPAQVHQMNLDPSVNYLGTIEELDGLCREGKVKEAVDVLALLVTKGVMLDIPRYLVLMQVCDDDKFLEQARKVYNYILKQFVNVEVRVSNKILDMFFKCGSAADAYQFFDSMPQRNLTSWDTMITGLANSGFGEDALDIFTEFKQKGLKPDGGLFVSVFSACGSLGAVDEGLLHFKSMNDCFGIAPGMEHYIGIVDMFGRAGYLDEALEFIERMPVDPSIDIWETLMTLSRLNGNLELGNRCAEIVEQFDPCRLDEQSKKGLLHVKASDLSKENERKKASEIKRVHEYRAGDTSHPENDKIYGQLRCLTQQMKEAGYVADLRYVLHDVDQESKEEALLAHSERLALSYGLMTTRARSDIRIMKNLRVCGDCHNALKIMSKLVGRQIIARDAKRFHHFANGVCSCNDYW